jgi:predicted PurR-regulated permease PerM
MGWRTSDILRAAAAVLGVYLLIRLLWFAYPLVFVTFLGVLFGLAVSSGVDRLERFRIPRGVAAAVIVFGFLALLGGLVAWTAPVLRDQSRELRTKLPQAIDNLDRWIASQRGGMIGSMLTGGQAASQSADALTPDAAGGAGSQGGRQGGAGEPESRPGSATAPPEPPQPAIEGAAQRADSAAARQDAQPAGQAADSAAQGTARPGGLRARLGSALSSASQYLFGFLTSTLSAITGLVLVVFLSIYIAADPGQYHRGMMHLFPHASRNRAGEVLSAVAAVLRRWLRTQLIAMLVIGVVTTAALLILGIPAAIPLGILAGLFEFIPTVGPILSAIPAVTMGFVDSPEKALTVAIVYGAIQFAENNFLIPMLMKEGMDIPPALTILAQALMALIFGFLGLLVAVPMLAATKVAVSMLYIEDVVGDDIEIPEVEDD